MHNIIYSYIVSYLVTIAAQAHMSKHVLTDYEIKA